MVVQGFDDPNNLLRKAVDQAMGGHPSEKDGNKKVEKIEFTRSLDNPANGRRNESDMFKVANSGACLVTCIPFTFFCCRHTSLISVHHLRHTFVRSLASFCFLLAHMLCHGRLSLNNWSVSLGGCLWIQAPTARATVAATASRFLPMVRRVSFIPADTLSDFRICS